MLSLLLVNKQLIGFTKIISNLCLKPKQMLIKCFVNHCRPMAAKWPSVSSVVTQRRLIHKDYDKVIRLLPEKVEYKYNDPKFKDKHRLEDQAYVKRTDDEIVDLSRVKLEKDYENTQFVKINIKRRPYKQVLVGQPDRKGFTQTETIADKDLWFWVERLFPKKVLPPIELTDDPVVYPSGWRPPPLTKPSLPYFIERTPGRLMPVYRIYRIEGRDYKTYWKNRWDSKINHWKKEILEKIDETKWETNETTVTLTTVRRVKGDIWKFEEDLRSHLEAHHKRRILSAVNEVNGVLTLKGDLVMECVQWLIAKGF